MAEGPAERVVNWLLAGLIGEAGFSNAELARRVGQLGREHGLDLRYDKTSVTRWLRGQQPRGATPALIGEVLTRRLGRSVPTQALGFGVCSPVYAGLEFAETHGQAVDIASGLWREDSGGNTALAKIAFAPSGLVVPSRDWLIGRANEPVGRADPARTAGLQVPEQGKPSVPVQRHTGRAAWPRVMGGDITALCSAGDLFHALDQTYGGGHARQALVSYLAHEAEPLLRGTYGEVTGRRLFAAVADLTRLAGWTAYDTAAHGLAQRYFVQALRFTQAAGDRVYGCYVLVTMSSQASYLGHGREAVQLARVAQQGVGAGAGAQPVVQAMLHSAEARGHAACGDGRACAASMVRAERALGAVRPGDEVPYWARFYDEGQLAGEFAHCHRDLHQYRACAQQAERSLRLRAPGYARSRLLSRLVLATARLGLGDLEQACAMGAAAARQAAEMRSARAVDYVRAFERRLGPYHDTAAAREYHDQVATLP
ncbi:regulator [Streptomyces sp. TBY4]|uniref:regulator n=1 Tax=Streptomyces sp. TBY4 TaxID=2962030 RepID=UPI0020B6C495|nr:regulator [Streptomyces sp. TBY4]MCP3760740.1 regulator [Streptomyces sp. TBY4]